MALYYCFLPSIDACNTFVSLDGRETRAFAPRLGQDVKDVQDHCHAVLLMVRVKSVVLPNQNGTA